MRAGKARVRVTEVRKAGLAAEEAMRRKAIEIRCRLMSGEGAGSWFGGGREKAGGAGEVRVSRRLMVTRTLVADGKSEWRLIGARSRLVQGNALASEMTFRDENRLSHSESIHRHSGSIHQPSISSEIGDGDLSACIRSASGYIGLANSASLVEGTQETDFPRSEPGRANGQRFFYPFTREVNSGPPVWGQVSRIRPWPDRPNSMALRISMMQVATCT